MWANVFFAQMPPTPTPMPPGEQMLDFSPLDGLRPWEIAPQVVGLWNQFNQAGAVVQLAILLLLIFAAIFFLMKQFKAAGKNEEEA